MDTDHCGRLLPRRELVWALRLVRRRIDTASLFPDAAVCVPFRARKREAEAQVHLRRERRRWLRRRRAGKVSDQLVPAASGPRLPAAICPAPTDSLPSAPARYRDNEWFCYRCAASYLQT